MLWGLVTAVAQSRFGRWIAGAVMGLALFAGMLWQMRRGILKTVKLENEVDRLKGAVKADDRMDHADIGSGASDDDNREWLRERGSKRGKSGS